MIGYHALNEQFSPSELLQWTIMAEQAGFCCINCSYHFHSWSDSQGQSGFDLVLLGYDMLVIRSPFSVVCAPGQRYHPAIVAQAIATLEEMFPGRFSIALGSGEALNENITGEKWPAKEDRNKRLKESVDVIRRLLNGEMISHKGAVIVEHDRLYTLPAKITLLIGAAGTKETAAWMGTWSDGMITVHREHCEREQDVAALRNHGRDGKQHILKAKLSYSKNEEEALKGAYDQWRTNIFQSTVLAEMWTVEQFDAMGEFVQHEELKKMVRISADIDQHIEWIKKD